MTVARRRLGVVGVALAATGLAAAGCAAPGAHGGAAPTVSRGATAAGAPRTASPALPRCASAADVDRLHGQRVVLEGRYEVEPVPGGKRLQAALIVLPDRTRLIRSYRPVPEEFRFVNKRVVVVGRVFRDAGEPPTVQQVTAPHVRPEHIDLAPGETPYPTRPTELPAPPVVRSAAELDAQADRWVQAWGTLTKVTPHQEDGLWANATVRLDDGTEVHLRAVTRSRWERLVGAAVTVVARAEAKPAAAMGGSRRLVDRATLCAGHVARCLHTLGVP